MEQSSAWEANSRSRSQFYRLLRNSKDHMSTSPRHWSLSWTSLIKSTFPPCFIKIRLNVILPPSILWIGRPSDDFSSGFPCQYFVRISHLSRACYMPCSPHPPWSDHSNNRSVWRRVRRVLKSKYCGSFLYVFPPSSCYFFPLRLNPRPCVTFRNYFYVSVRDW
jgi:hypothetical protein